MPSEVVAVRMDEPVLRALDGLVEHCKRADHPGAAEATRANVIRWAICRMAEEVGVEVPSVERAGTYVYFVQSTGPSGVIKIGTTEKRAGWVKELEKVHPVALKVLGVIPGGWQVERTIHLLFEHVRARGGWFLPDPVLLQYIEGAVARSGLNGAVSGGPGGSPGSVVPSDVEGDLDKMFEGLDGEAVREGT